MDVSIEATASSMQSLSEQYCAVAHNLANANTAGFKRRMSAFAQSLQQQTLASASAPPAQAGTISATTAIDFTQGALTSTERPLDLAISGDGFFVIETTSGPVYTRNGSFGINGQRQLADSNGRLVGGESGPITIPAGAGDINVAADGAVSVGGQSIGKLAIVAFADESLLLPAGASCFRAGKGAAPIDAEGATVRQGYQESSNVNVMEELVNLIAVTRLYEANAKSIERRDELMNHLLQVAAG